MRRGRNATGLYESAGLPNRGTMPNSRTMTAGAPGCARVRPVVRLLGLMVLVAVFLGLAAPVAGANGIALGAYVQPAATPGHPYAAIDKLDAEIGRHLAIYQSFEDWQTSAGVAQAFPLGFASYVAGLGATPMVTWQPEDTPLAGQRPASQVDFSLAQILTGRYDPLIRVWADGARAFGLTVYVRLMHEMNGAWYPWGNGVNGNTPAQYVAAWQHVVTLFRGEGATNVRFVWCASSSIRAAAAPYFPGDAWSSWIALDGYNKATTWKTFTQVVATRYADITSVSDLPVMIAETASIQDPLRLSGKADWILSTFLTEIPQVFPRVQAALYFDAPVGGTRQVLQLADGSLAAFTQVAADPQYQAPAPG